MAGPAWLKRLAARFGENGAVCSRPLPIHLRVGARSRCTRGRQCEENENESKDLDLSNHDRILLCQLFIQANRAIYLSYVTIDNIFNEISVGLWRVTPLPGRRNHVLMPGLFALPAPLAFGLGCLRSTVSLPSVVLALFMIVPFRSEFNDPALCVEPGNACPDQWRWLSVCSYREPGFGELHGTWIPANPAKARRQDGLPKRDAWAVLPK